MISESGKQFERVTDPERIAELMREAVRAAILQHKRAGNPIAVWRDGRVEWIAPADIDVEEGPA